MPTDKKELIFISHSTPEDNAFTMWLSTRLKLMGYQVWSDVTQLFGGEKWWDDIEQAVDQYTCKFILVITKTSLSKPGVQREVKLALAAEEKYELANFIIPVIIDDSGFGGHPYGLSERNIIPFSAGWGEGLGRLIERLTRDRVPVGEVAGDLGKKLLDLIPVALKLEKKQDLVISNWLKVVSIPKYLSFYRLPIKPASWRNQLSDFPFPWFEWGGMLVTFAESNDLKAYLPGHMYVTSDPRLDLTAVLENKPRKQESFQRGEVIKKINFLLAEAWNLHMQCLGLHRYELASGKQAWFFPEHEDYNGMRPFADVFGEVRKKLILGFSAKNEVHWHYAVEAKFQYGPYAKASLIPHVVFTEDGKNPIKDKGKMHRLRRGFCKSWWNPRWRDLLLLFLNLLAKGEGTFPIALSSKESLVLAGRPDILKSEYSLIGNTEIENKDEQDIDVEVSD